MPKSINEIWTVFKLINKLPNDYKKIQIAPLRGASGIEIVINYWEIVDEFEKCPNVIDTFWQIFKNNLRPA